MLSNYKMSITFNNQSDPLDSLPTDQTPPTHPEIQIVESLFKEQHTTVQKFFNGTKDVLIFTGLFVLISLPQVDEVLKKFFPSSASSQYSMLFCKAVLFAFTYFIIKNWYLVRK